MQEGYACTTAHCGIISEVVGFEALLRLVGENMSGESQSRCAQPEMAQARWYTRGFKWRS